MNEQQKITPLMQQYHHIKSQFADTLVFFQVGDFYELFFEDAQKAAGFLGITLTTRGKHLDQPIPLCGVPVHTKDHYLAKLVKGGFKVALCDQLEPSVPGKVVARGITQVLTPGTLADTQLLDEKSASYILAFFPTDTQWGILFGELLTSQLFATSLSGESYKTLDAELVRYFPDEILIPNTMQAKPFRSYFSGQGFYTTVAHNEEFEDEAELAWIRMLQNVEKKTGQDSIGNALRLFYRYIKRNQEHALSEFTTINFYKPEDFLGMDAATQRHLELIKNNQDGSRTNTLFSLLDRAATSAGSRMIKKWIVRPLLEKKSIMRRQEIIKYMLNNILFMQQLYQLLRSIGDVERLIGRIAIKRGLKNDYVQLGKSLSQLPELKVLLQEYGNGEVMQACILACSGFEQLSLLLTSSLNDDHEKTWIIQQGFNKKLDELRILILDSSNLMVSLERQEQTRTGISSLKIRYTSVYGYYIEITKSNVHLVPPDYIRYQTLVGKERFTMPALKEIEQKIVAAEHTVLGVEQEIFEQLKKEVAFYIPKLRKAAYAISHLDALLGFSCVAHENNYTCPQFSENGDLDILQGRHPVVEQKLGSRFIPNDIVLNEEKMLWVITGPNMGGKSTFLRQTALIAIMAQCGSFVPAQSVKLPIFDAIFTRIGASDNVAEGKSTFLVEMEETADICNNATQKSLLILDEVGRGTSTFDGLAIAQAVVEHIYNKVQAYCLFATHYHELTTLHEQFPGIGNYHAASRKTQNGILLLYKILPGIADGSFGLEVAKLAQLPPAIIERAYQVINSFQDTSFNHISEMQLQSLSANKKQLKNGQDCKKVDHYKKYLAKLAVLDMEHITPRQALEILWSLKEQCKKLLN